MSRPRRWTAFAAFLAIAAVVSACRAAAGLPLG